MQNQPVYVVVGTVYANNDTDSLIIQEFIECETHDQAAEQSAALEKQLKIFYPKKKVMTWINQF